MQGAPTRQLLKEGLVLSAFTLCGNSVEVYGKSVKRLVRLVTFIAS
jgi:uncharacterized integral membrane protein